MAAALLDTTFNNLVFILRDQGMVALERQSRDIFMAATVSLKAVDAFRGQFSSAVSKEEAKWFKREAEKAGKAEKPPRPAPALQPDGPTKKNKRWVGGGRRKADLDE